MQSLLWSQILQIITGGFPAALIRQGAIWIARSRGWNEEAFVKFVLWLSTLPQEAILRAQDFLTHQINFGAPNTPPGATDTHGQHDPDLPEEFNEFYPQLLLLRGAIAEERYITDGVSGYMPPPPKNPNAELECKSDPTTFSLKEGDSDPDDAGNLDESDETE